MSTIATNPDGVHTADTLAGALDSNPVAVAEHLAALGAVGLLVSRPGAQAAQYSLSGEAWLRFGRLLSGKPGYVAIEQSSAESGIASLPHPIQKIADRLAYRFSTHFSRETVEKYVADSYRLLSERARTNRHLPSLTSRFASERLGALASAQGFDISGTPEVLFVCVQNSGRSQMAAGILRQLAGNRIHVRTAGSQPATSIDALVVDVLDEIGVPVLSEFPKPLTDEVVQAADIVITMGCGDACPVYPGRRYMDWKIDDPLGRSLQEVRAIRDEIQRRVEELLTALDVPHAAG